MAIEDAIGNTEEVARDPRIIGGTPEEMAAKDVVAGGGGQAVTPGPHVAPDPEKGPVLSETPVIDGEQADADVPDTDDQISVNRRIIAGLSGRIDRIVDALSKSKSVKNL